MTLSEAVLPDYDGGSIVNLMASIRTGLGGEAGRYAALKHLPDSRVEGARQIALVVIDGLGFDFLRQHADKAPTLSQYLHGSMTSVFPSTTAAAIGTFLTGVAPVEHGLTGWHMYLPELGAVLAVLPGFARGGTSLYSERVDVRALLGTVPFSELVPVTCDMVAPRSIAGSPFNLAHQGRSNLHVYDSLTELFELTAHALHGPGRRFTYSYWPDLDSAGHRFGMGSEQTLQLVRDLDTAFANFLESIAGTETLVVLTADHGHINSDAERTFVLNDFPAINQHLALPLCGEPRAAYAYVHAHQTDAFEEAMASQLGGHVTIQRSEDVLSQGWFGPGEPHSGLKHRVGDYVLLPQHDRMVRDWLPVERPFPLQSSHGGLSPAEMMVPLVLMETG